ncbi:hypothetical protein Tco_0379487 [Tanacetum coccineum]
MVSSLNNNEIDLRISFDESDDEDYTVVFNKNSFSYKIISTNDLKTDSENDNEKVNMPLFPSPEPSVSCIDDLDFFKDFENEFPAIVRLNQISQLNPLYALNISMNLILKMKHRCPNMMKRNKTNVAEAKVEGYTEEIVHDFEQRLETIFGRQVNRVHTLDFEGLTPDMRQDLAERLRMEFILEFFSTCRIGSEMGLDVADTLCFQLGGARRRSERVIPDKGDLSDYLVKISSGRDFLRCAPSYTYIRDSVRRLRHNMDRGTANVPYLLAQYMFKHAEGRKSGARLSRGHFIGHLAHHFGLLSDDVLSGLSVVTREIPLIDMAAKDAPVVNEDAQADPAPVQAPQPPPPPLDAGRTMPQRLGRLEEEMQGLRQDVRSLRGLVERSMTNQGVKIEEEMQGLRQDVRSLRGLVERSMTNQGRFSTWMISCMAQLMKASGQTYQATILADLAEKKSTMLVENLRSGNFEVLES